MHRHMQQPSRQTWTDVRISAGGKLGIDRTGESTNYGPDTPLLESNKSSYRHLSPPVRIIVFLC